MPKRLTAAGTERARTGHHLIMVLLIVLLILAAIIFGVGFAVKGALLVCLIVAGLLVVGAIARGVSGRRASSGV